MSTRPHVQEARERFKKISEGHFVWFVVFLQCSEIESDCFEVFQYLPPARMKVTQLMSTRPHVQEARERFKKIGEGHVVRCVVFLQCSEIESDCFQIFQSFGNPQISPFNFLSCSACWSKKQDAGMETSHAKRIFSDNGTCFGKNKRCSNRSHLPQCFIKALRFLLAWLNWCLHGHTCKKLEKGSRR